MWRQYEFGFVTAFNDAQLVGFIKKLRVWQFLFYGRRDVYTSPETVGGRPICVRSDGIQITFVTTERLVCYSRIPGRAGSTADHPQSDQCWRHRCWCAWRHRIHYPSGHAHWLSGRHRPVCFMREFILPACIITPKNFYWVTSVGTPTTNGLGKNVRFSTNNPCIWQTIQDKKHIYCGRPIGNRITSVGTFSSRRFPTL